MNSFLKLLSIPIALLSILSFSFLHPTHFLGWKALMSSQQVADLVVRNGVIYTGDDSLPFAESMAVANGRVVRVGNHSYVQELASYGTEVLDLGGKVVVPGFIDSHVHFIPGGLQVQNEVLGFWVEDGTMIYGEEICQLHLGLTISLLTIPYGYQEQMVTWAWLTQWH